MRPSFPVRRLGTLAGRTGLAAVGPSDKVHVAMSSGVDSSTAAAVLAHQLGPNRVEGVFMNNWTGAKCADGDWRQVQQVADQIGIRCHRVNLEKDYWNEVFEPMLERYRNGITPNPDVACNRFIKFGSLLDHLRARTPGFRWLATGHYAGIEHVSGSGPDTASALYRPADLGKDQSYYLSTVGASVLSSALFPLAGLKKHQVRELAREFGLPTANKKDSQGLCFVEQSDRGFHKFLSEFLEPSPGPITLESGEVVGQHSGLWTATIGQRTSLAMPQSRPEFTGKWYVADKIPGENRMVIARGGDHPSLLTSAAACETFQWHRPRDQTRRLTAQFRSLQTPAEIQDVHQTPESTAFTFATPQRAVAPGQYLVVYDNDQVVGAGEISQTWREAVLAGEPAAAAQARPPANEDMLA